MPPSAIFIFPDIYSMNDYKQSLYVAIIRICANIIMLAAVFIAMYQAARWPGWPSEAVFCLIFFSITIPAWVGACLLIRHLRHRWPNVAQTLMRLPGHEEEQLVTWTLLEHHPATPGPSLRKPL